MRSFCWLIAHSAVSLTICAGGFPTARIGWRGFGLVGNVERPGAADSAFVLVHASPGCTRGALTVTGTAEGLVNGQRRCVPLEIAATQSAGVYRVRRQWPSEGVWVLRLVVHVGTGSATALVGVNASGEIAQVRQQDPARRIYPYLTDADVQAMLHALAQ